MTQNAETNTLNEFDQARALVLSYVADGADDTKLLEVLMTVRETCGHAALNKLLVLLEAVGDPRFDEYGGADALAILRDLTITDDLNADVETLIEAMRVQDAAARKEAERNAAEISDPYKKAAERLLKKFREPNYAQVAWELAHL